MDRLYRRKCRRIYEPDVPDAFLGAPLLMRIMLLVAFFKVRMRISLESIFEKMRNSSLSMFHMEDTEHDLRGIRCTAR